MSQTRSTRQREAIRRVLAEVRRPLLPHDVQQLAQRHAPGLGIATVYRHLRAGLDEGWLLSVELPGEVARYELSPSEHHHHFHCRRCDQVFDFNGCPGSLAELAPPGFFVNGHEVILYGFCLDCLARERAPSTT